MNTASHPLSFERVKAEPTTLLASVMAFALGATLVFTVGFAHPELLHNPGHDWRHSMNFPCH
jgi:cobalt transporter subunit CbtB